MRLINADEVQDRIAHLLSDYMTDETREAFENFDVEIASMPTVCDIDTIRAEIKDVYDDNRACEQDDVAYGLKVALDIIKEHTKGVN